MAARPTRDGESAGDSVELVLLEPASPDALAAARALREAHPEVAVVCASIYPRDRTPADFRSAVHLVKPVGLAELDRSLGARTHPLLGRASVHASRIEGGVEMSSYPAHCRLGLERRTLPGETARTVEAQLEALLDDCRAADPALEAAQRTLLERAPFAVCSFRECSRLR